MSRETFDLGALRGAAAKGDRDAQLELGRRLLDGIAVGADAREAVRWLDLAAQAAEPSAEYLLEALLWGDPFGDQPYRPAPERDSARGKALLEKAASLGIAAAQYLLGSLGRAWYRTTTAPRASRQAALSSR